MEQSKALQALKEAGDLVRMLEEITHPNVLASLSAASMPGVRITLKNVRESIISSHDALAGQVIQRAKVQLDSNAGSGIHSVNGTALHPERLTSKPQGEQAPVLSRKDLRASIEKIIEKSER